MEAIPTSNDFVQSAGRILHPGHHTPNVIDLTAIGGMGTGEAGAVAPKFLNQLFEDLILSRVMYMAAEHIILVVVGSLIERHWIVG